MTLRLRRMAAIFALVLVALTLATCISAEQHDYVTYDANKDEFQMLMVMTDIRGKDADDLDYMLAVYKNRDHLIAPALPGGANALALVPYTFLRTGEKQMVALNIYASRPSELEKTDVPFSLSNIQVHPGTFFVQDKKLGFYQSITVPGATVDAALAEISKAMQDEDMVKNIQTEIDRRNAGGKMATWEQVTAEAVKQMVFPTGTEPASQPATQADQVEPQFALDMETLNNLKQAIADKKLLLKRNKTAITLALPMTARDAAGLAGMYKAAIARGQELVKTTKETEENSQDLHMAKTALQVTEAMTITPADKSLTLSLDLLQMAQGFASKPVERIDMNDKDGDKTSSADAVKYMQDHKVAVDQTITLEQIVKDFNAGKLKSYPSDKPVTPGEGIPTPK